MSAAPRKLPNLFKEMGIGLGIGLVGGYLWKRFHWREQRKVADYYREVRERGHAPLTPGRRAKLGGRPTMEDLGI